MFKWGFKNWAGTSLFWHFQNTDKFGLVSLILSVLQIKVLRTNSHLIHLFWTWHFTSWILQPNFLCVFINHSISYLFWLCSTHSMHIFSKQKECCSSCLSISRPAEFPAGRLLCFQPGINTQMSNCSAFPSQAAIGLHLMRLMLRLMQDLQAVKMPNQVKDYCMFIIARHLLLSNCNSCIVPCYCWSVC